MYFFEAYVFKITKHDLINTFSYQNLTQIPTLKKITLNFGYQKSNIKHLIFSILALEFISFKKGKITKSKHINLFLKIKKGNPVGCVVVLKKSAMHLFYVRMKTLFSPNKIQLWKDLRLTKSISFHLKNPLIFPELENQFQFFKTIPRLDITLITTSNSQKELFFLLKSIKFFL